MNSVSFSGVWALASMLSATSKVFTSNWRVLTVTLSVSCGCFCSIRLCGARGFSKLMSLMYWPCRVSGPVWAWPGAGGTDEGVSVMICLKVGAAGGTMQGCTAQDAGRCGGPAIAKAGPRRDDKALILLVFNLWGSTGSWIARPYG